MAKRCSYCFRPANYMPTVEEGPHNEGCPTMGDGETLKEWKKGFQSGWNWDHEGIIRHWQWKHYSKAFILGYRAGKEEIDDLVDEVAQAMYA